MGDRANIYLVDEDPEHGIYLYSHWGGYELAQTLREALHVGKPRWSDPQYLARIIFDQATKEGRDQETGYGLSTEMCDNEYPVLVVDLRKQEVHVAPEKGERDESQWARVGTYAEYVAQGADVDPRR